MKVGILAFCMSLAVAYGFPGAPCSDLSGVWRNELGSNMTLAKLNSDSLKIIGTYSTSVESSKGAARISSPVTGLVQPTDGGSVVAFNVLWNHGASLTSWVGQCIVCDGKEIIYTTWVLRSLMTPLRKWMTTRINQDTFWRLESEEVLPPTPEPGTPSTELLGLWTSESGDSFNINFAASVGIVEGELLTPGVNGDASVQMFGTVDGNTTYTALGFAAASNSKIRGWTGHIYNPHDSNPIMETSWLGHSFSNSCTNPRKFVNYGMNNYTQPTTGDSA